MFAKTTGTLAGREVGGLWGNGKKVTTPEPPQGTVIDVGIGFDTPYLVKVTAPMALGVGGGAPKKTEMDVALLPVKPVLDTEAEGTRPTSTVWPTRG